MTNHYRKEALLGVVDFARSQHWILDTSMRFDGVFPTEMDVDGILVLGGSKRIDQWLSERRETPVVYLGGEKDCRPGFRVKPDYDQVGRDAAKHLLSLGFLNHVYCGAKGDLESLRMRKAFFQEIHSLHQTEVIEYVAPFNREAIGPCRQRRVEYLADQLRNQTTPFGVFVDDDGMALEVMSACEMLGLRIPQDVSVLGCGNSEIEISMSRVALSSIDLNWRRVGRAAASMLEDLVRGKLEPKVKTIKPMGVFARASTSTFVTSNPMITRVIMHIRRHYAENLKSADLAKMAGMTERNFRIEFRNLVGHSPRAEIFKSRLSAARRMLRDSDLKLDAIALESGFGNARKLCSVFAESHHMTPSHWRDQIRNS